MKRAVALTGMPLCGKTTTGRLLSELLGFRLQDTDRLLEQETGMKISDIFAAKGEEGFRRLEAELVSRLSFDKTVISTGGGTLINEASCKLLLENCFVIYLYLPPGELAKRYSEDCGRPLLRDMTSIEALYAKRCDLYEANCDFRLECAGLSPELAAKTAAECYMIYND